MPPPSLSARAPRRLPQLEMSEVLEAAYGHFGFPCGTPTGSKWLAAGRWSLPAGGYGRWLRLLRTLYDGRWCMEDVESRRCVTNKALGTRQQPSIACGMADGRGWLLLPRVRRISCQRGRGSVCVVADARVMQQIESHTDHCLISLENVWHRAQFVCCGILLGVPGHVLIL